MLSIPASGKPDDVFTASTRCHDMFKKRDFFDTLSGYVDGIDMLS